MQGVDKERTEPTFLVGEGVPESTNEASRDFQLFVRFLGR